VVATIVDGNNIIPVATKYLFNMGLAHIFLHGGSSPFEEAVASGGFPVRVVVYGHVFPL
jgi:hypothetical protein